MRILFPIVNNNNQKLNTRNSNELYIVVVHNYLPDVCCTKYFMEAQGYQVMGKLLTKTTMAPFSCIIMVSHQVASAPIISTFVFFNH